MGYNFHKTVAWDEIHLVVYLWIQLIDWLIVKISEPTCSII